MIITSSNISGTATHAWETLQGRNARNRSLDRGETIEVGLQLEATRLSERQQKCDSRISSLDWGETIKVRLHEQATRLGRDRSSVIPGLVHLTAKRQSQ